jgi:hypothetical protein
MAGFYLGIAGKRFGRDGASDRGHPP